MRTVGLLVALCVAVGVVAFAVRGCARPVPGPAGINYLTAQDVASIEAHLYGVDGFPDVGPFLAASEDHDQLLALVQGGEVTKKHLPWVTLGGMGIRLRDGREIGVSLWWPSEGPGAYSIDYTTWRGSSNEEIIRTIRECAKRGKPVAGE